VLLSKLTDGEEQCVVENEEQKEEAPAEALNEDQNQDAVVEVVNEGQKGGAADGTEEN